MAHYEIPDAACVLTTGEKILIALAIIVVLVATLFAQPVLTGLGERRCEQDYSRARTALDSAVVDRRPAMRSGSSHRLTCLAIRRSKVLDNQQMPVDSQESTSRRDSILTDSVER